MCKYHLKRIINPCVYIYMYNVCLVVFTIALFWIFGPRKDRLAPSACTHSCELTSAWESVRRCMHAIVSVFKESLFHPADQDGRATAVQGRHGSDEGEEAEGVGMHRALRWHLLRREGAHEPGRPQQPEGAAGRCYQVRRFCTLVAAHQYCMCT